MSQQTGVALGAIGPILTGLQEADYLINPGKANKRRLIKRRKLLDRWVEAYPEKLKPKLLVGEFTSANNAWWNTLNKLFAAAKLKKVSAQSETDIIHIYRPFWSDTLQINGPNLHPDTVHPILIYADLIASQDSRNLETANKLYDETIAGLIRED